MNYSAILNVLKSDKYIDNTDSFEDFLYFPYNTVGNCIHSGSSLFLTTFACFLDNTIDTKEIFSNLKIGKNNHYLDECNTYCVVWLDFSDFNANSYEEALIYIRQKMGEIYKHFYSSFIEGNHDAYNYYTHEKALDIIEGTASDGVLKCSLSNLLYQLKYQNRNTNDKKKIAILIDNLVSLEYIATQNGYIDQMRIFLQSFLIEEISNWCDLFLQIGDYRDYDDSFFSRGKYITYHYFLTPSSDLTKDYSKMAIPKELQHPFHYHLSIANHKKWDIIIETGRKTVSQAKHQEELYRQERVRKEKKRYAQELSPSIPLFSPNLGIREKRFDDNNAKYKELTTLLKAIYNEFKPQFIEDSIYQYFQKVNTDEVIVTERRSFADILEDLPAGIAKCKFIGDSQDTGYWIQVVYMSDKFAESPANPANMKVYASMKDMNVKNVFLDSLIYLLTNCEDSFAAKISVVNRSDQMCYWISPKDFRHLERFYMPYYNRMKASLPFIAYKGMLGISKDLPGTDISHNATMSHVIADYFNSVPNDSAINLKDMYNSYIARWNADIYDEAEIGFRGGSVLSYIVMLDTIDAILNGNGFSENSFLLTENKTLWRILASCRCWADLNEAYDKLSNEEKERLAALV